jgi:hypothetical protein
MKIAVEVEMSERDAEQFFHMLRVWQSVSMAHAITVRLMASARSRDEVQALMERLGFRGELVEMTPQTWDERVH